jgi:biopolymer transport protein ExbD
MQTTGSNESGEPMMDINTTPLIDVMLVLLVTLIVSLPIMTHAVKLDMPQTNNPPPPPDQDRTVVIVIDKDKSMKLNQDPILENQLQSRLNEIFKTRAERVVFVKGDPDLDFEVVARAIDIAKGANMEKVGLMTPKTELGQ